MSKTTPHDWLSRDDVQAAWLSYRKVLRSSGPTLGRPEFTMADLEAAFMAGAAVSAWQPIETAPMAGEEVLVYVASTQECFVAYWPGDAWVFATDHRGDNIACEPTHWMPLPAPPIKEPRP